MGRKKDRWKEVCRRMLWTIDPSFRSPAYFLSAREARVKVPADVCGWTNLGLAGDLRPLLTQRHEWHGPGFAAILALDKIGSTEELLAAAVHEFCHFVLFMAETSTIRATLGEERFYSILAEPSKETQREGRPPAPSSDRSEWRESHNAAFVRMAIHAQSRAAWRGKFLYVVDPTFYGLPPRMRFVAPLQMSRAVCWICHCRPWPRSRGRLTTHNSLRAYRPQHNTHFPKRNKHDRRARANRDRTK